MICNGSAAVLDDAQLFSWHLQSCAKSTCIKVQAGKKKWLCIKFHCKAMIWNVLSFLRLFVNFSFQGPDKLCLKSWLLFVLLQQALFRQVAFTSGKSTTFAIYEVKVSMKKAVIVTVTELNVVYIAMAVITMVELRLLWWWWLFPRMWGFGENVQQFIPRLHFFFLKVEISSRKLSTLSARIGPRCLSELRRL